MKVKGSNADGDLTGIYDHYAKSTPFYSGDVRVPAAVRERLGATAEGTLADLGCGDGNFLREATNHTAGRWRLIGIDVSERRCRATLKLVPEAIVRCSDVVKTGILDGSVDVVECSQVIEHLSDRKELIREVQRILRPGGIAHLASVARGRWAFYFRRKNGRFVLDHTHLIEYSSLDHFASEVDGQALSIVELSSYPLSYRVSDLALRFLERTRLINERTARSAYQRSRLLRLAARARIRIPGYQVVEMLLQRQA